MDLFYFSCWLIINSSEAFILLVLAAIGDTELNCCCWPDGFLTFRFYTKFIKYITIKVLKYLLFYWLRFWRWLLTRHVCAHGQYFLIHWHRSLRCQCLHRFLCWQQFLANWSIPSSHTVQKMVTWHVWSFYGLFHQLTIRLIFY